MLSYRGHPHVGGQGVYVRHLSAALTELGHHVTVLAGPPYPDVPPPVSLTKVPSLDLYRPDEPFRRPHREEFRSAIDVVEYALMCTAAFPEPLTFGWRVARLLSGQSSAFDVIHDNQSLGYGLLALARRGVPVLATIHHPISFDKRIDLEAAPSLGRRMMLRRWYSFTRMQARVARRLPRLIAVSEASKRDVVSEFKVKPHRVGVIHNGVDPGLFRPLGEIARKPGRIITTASADLPMKGLSYLIEALAKIRTERPAELVVVGKGGDAERVVAAAKRWGVEDFVRIEGSVDALRLVELYAQAQVAVVPSLYEGFSFPAVEAMSCGVPVVATTGGALPEVVGDHEATGLLVPPGDAGALAAAIGRLLDDHQLRMRVGRAGRERVINRFTWRAAAQATAEEYRRLVEAC